MVNSNEPAIGDGMFNDYSDITERIAEPPKWWDEQGVPRYAEFDPYRVANIYAQETALVEIACSACWRRFEVAFSVPGPGLEETIGSCSTLREAIEKGEIHYCDPPNYGNCRRGASMTCYDLRVLQYWSRANEKRSWVRNERLEIELPGARELNRLEVQRVIALFPDIRSR
jgi:hypothetical protein